MRWISVKDKLPEVKIKTYENESYQSSDRVLVFIPGRTDYFGEDTQIEIGTYMEYEHQSGLGWDVEEELRDDITHWMPLPKIPKYNNDEIFGRTDQSEHLPHGSI